MAGRYVLSPMRKLATTGSYLAWSSEAIELLGLPADRVSHTWTRPSTGQRSSREPRPFTEEGRHRNPGATGSVNGFFHLFPRTIDPR